MKKQKKQAFEILKSKKDNIINSKQDKVINWQNLIQYLRKNERYHIE